MPFTPQLQVWGGPERHQDLAKLAAGRPEPNCQRARATGRCDDVCRSACLGTACTAAGAGRTRERHGPGAEGARGPSSGPALAGGATVGAAAVPVSRRRTRQLRHPCPILGGRSEATLSGRARARPAHVRSNVPASPWRATRLTCAPCP